MRKILVVDDEKSLLELVEALLSSAGYDVLTAGGGREALDILKQEKVDLLLLDVMMPEMDGWDVVREMKSEPNMKNIPIAMLTVKTMSPQYFYSNEVEGLVDYINKPFSKKELLKRVEEIFEEVDRIESIKKSLESTNPKFLKEYEQLSKVERLYTNLVKSMELSLSKMDDDNESYGIVKDALDYGKILLEGIREKKTEFEGLMEKKG